MNAKILLAVLALAAGTTTARAQGIFLEAESFENHGGWSVDQQFMDIMGSPYLIAHGMGKPVEDASTSFRIAEAGTYHIYVRTYNWTSPWSRGEGPGGFQVRIDGRKTGGTAGAAGDAWEWQPAGKAKLKSGTHTLSLHDLKGFDGRCDAVWITRREGVTPPQGGKELDAFRRSAGAVSATPEDGGKFDLVVVGAGIGGMCTAVSAARLGLNVALVSDRPKLGGNNSSEVRVHLGGKIEMAPYPALGRMVREFGHSRGGNARPAEYYEDEKKEAFIAAEPNVHLFSCYRAVAVEMDGPGIIGSVIVRSTLTGKELRLEAPLFCDCTGDGNLGFMAGADWRMGREGRDEFGESLAPERPDSLTMGASVQWYSRAVGSKCPFPEFSYGAGFSEDSCEKVWMGEWTWETGMDRDQIAEAERIRDYGLLVVYSNWSFLKNRWSGKANVEDRELSWVAYVAGKRESRRLIGDYILKQDDVTKQVFHEDASFTINWHFDLHFPDSLNTRYFKGEPFKAVTKHNPIPTYAVPYRCLYSRNIGNLFMAGRNISVTHVTLGSTRLMRNIAMMGEVVGMAASLCIKHGTCPRDIYQHHLPELKELMKKGTGKPEPLPDNQHFNEGDFRPAESAARMP
jgi:hypothetical protein